MNVNAGSSDQQIAEAQPDHTRVSVLWKGVDPGSAELDCGGSPDPANPNGWIGGLVYCTRGGTGRYQPTEFTPLAAALPFPACCDPDGNGLGSLTDTQARGLRSTITA